MENIPFRLPLQDVASGFSREYESGDRPSQGGKVRGFARPQPGNRRVFLLRTKRTREINPGPNEPGDPRSTVSSDVIFVAHPAAEYRGGPWWRSAALKYPNEPMNGAFSDTWLTS